MMLDLLRPLKACSCVRRSSPTYQGQAIDVCNQLRPRDLQQTGSHCMGSGRSGQHLTCKPLASEALSSLESLGRCVFESWRETWSDDPR